MHPETLEHVWREHGEELRRFLAARVPPGGDADDVLHDVLIKALTTAHPVVDPANTRGWLFRVARNALVDQARRGPTAPLPSPATDTQDALGEMRGRLVRCVRPFVDRLPPADRDIIVAVDLEGASQLGIARELGLSHSAVKSRVQRARERLAQLFRRCCTFDRDARGEIVDYTCREQDCPARPD